jgi:D-3-phosphoglycerate dehydrogenase
MTATLTCVDRSNLAAPLNPSPRIARFDSNEPAALAAAGPNIENLLNKSRDKYAYILIDLNAAVRPETLQLIRSTKGVLSARVIPKSAVALE